MVVVDVDKEAEGWAVGWAVAEEGEDHHHLHFVNRLRELDMEDHHHPTGPTEEEDREDL